MRKRGRLFRLVSLAMLAGCSDDRPSGPPGEVPPLVRLTCSPEAARVEVYHTGRGRVANTVTPAGVWLLPGSYRADFKAEGHDPGSIGFPVPEGRTEPMDVFLALHPLPPYGVAE